jgi:hypothetical protein
MSARGKAVCSKALFRKGAFHDITSSTHDRGSLLNLVEFESARQYAMRGLQIWRSGNVRSYAEDFHTPVVSCLCHQAMSEWLLGEIAASRTAIAEAISIAKELKDMNALALALSWAAGLGCAERNPAEVGRYSSDLIELSTGHNFVFG